MSAVEVIQGGSAVLYAALCTLILVRGRVSRTGILLAASCAVTASTCLAYAWPGNALDSYAATIDLLQSLAWYGFVFHLFRSCVPRSGLLRIFGIIGVVSFGLIIVSALTPSPGQSVFSAAISGRLALAVGRLLLIENLYVNTPNRQRWHVTLPCISLGGLALFDILICADIVLQHHVSPELNASRAIAIAVVAPLLAVAAARVRSWQVDIHISRTAAFHSATLVVSGVFLLTLAALGEATRRIAADWATVIEISLVFAGLLAIGVLLTSYRARLRFRTIVVDHFFSARFDYRHEWSRCVETLSASDNDTTLHARVIRAAAEAVNSPGGALFLRETDAGAFEWAGDWNCNCSRTAILPNEPFVDAFGRGAWVVEAVTPDAVSPEKAAPWPASLASLPGAWLAVPLPQRASLIGFIVLVRPPVSLRLDQEVFDLLRMVAREVAAFIAEQRATRVMIQTRELHDYSKRFAFVAHDIKNVSSQLSLLLGNAEVHITNPAFQQDMLTTVRASVARIGSLLRRLEAPDADQSSKTALPVPRLETILADYRRRRGRELVIDADDHSPVVDMNADAFDTVVMHLLNNAVEATETVAELSPIIVRVRADPARVHIHIKDAGPGMSSEFIRDELFSPFRTSKRGGSGIGAFQARELLRAAGGDLLVESAPGQGTTMQLLLNRADIQTPLLQSA